MLKKLGPYARPYSKWIAVGVLCSAAEAIFELLIPLVMADIVNIGIETANQNYILQKGLLMMGMAVISLCFGLGAAASSSVAGQGFGAELRRAEYEHIQDFAFSNIEKFSTASLVTRLTNDVNNMQMTLMMGMRLLVRAPVMLVAALVLSIRLSREQRISGGDPPAADRHRPDPHQSGAAVPVPPGADGRPEPGGAGRPHRHPGGEVLRPGGL